MAMVWRVLKKIGRNSRSDESVRHSHNTGAALLLFFLYPEKNEIKEKKNNLYTRSKKKTARGFPFLEMIKKKKQMVHGNERSTRTGKKKFLITFTYKKPKNWGNEEILRNKNIFNTHTGIE